MNREITFNISSIDEIYVSSDTFNGWYTGRRLYAGQSGEDEATRLTFEFGSDFAGFTASIYFGDTVVDSGSLSTGSMDIEYDIVDTYMVPEVIKMRITATDGTQTFKSRLIYLEVSR